MFNKEVLQELSGILTRKHYTVSVAESVTAGLMQAALASAMNASFFFQGGLTAYNARQKYTHLQVDPLHAISCNCVSETMAADMALGVARSFSSDWAIGITGYASPLPGHDMDTLYAFYAISFRRAILKAGEITAEAAEPLQVQLRYVDLVLINFRDALKTSETV